MILTNTQERTRFLKFCVVGTIGAVVDFGTFNLLSFAFTIPALYAQGISFTCAVISNFLWNRYWTYPDSRSKSVRRQVIQFFLVNLVGLCIRTPLFSGMEKVLTDMWENIHGPVFSATFFGHNMALAIAVLVVMMWNFFINRFWTYNDVN